MEIIDLGLIQSDQSVEQKVIEVYETLKLFKDAHERQEWIRRRTECWDAIENRLFDDKTEAEMRKQGQIPLPINKLVKGVQGLSAMVTDQKPQIQFLPVGSGDLYVAELLKRRFDLIWERNEGNDTTYEVVEECSIGAHGFFSARLDKSKSPFGRVVFEADDPEDIFWDKDSRKRDYSDTDLIKAKKRDRQYIRDNYGDLEDGDIYFNPGLTKGDEETVSTGLTTGDNYADGLKDPVSPEVKARQKIIWEIEAWMLKTREEDWLYQVDERGNIQSKRVEQGQGLPKGVKTGDEVEPGVIYWRRKVTKRIQRIIVGKKLVEEKENPYGTDQDGEPIIHLVGLKAQRTKNAYAMSPTMYALPINKEKIKRRAQAIHAASHMVNAPIVRPAGKTRWEGEPGTAGSELIVDPNSPWIPTRLPSGSMDAVKFFQLEQQADQEIDDMYNLHDVMRGKIPQGQANIAGKTVLALQDFGGMMNKPFLRSIESALVRLAKVVIALVLEVSVRREDWERLLEDEEVQTLRPDKKFDGLQNAEEIPDEEKQQTAARWEEAINILMDKKLSVVDLDVKIVAGSSMPSNRIAKLQVAMEMYSARMVDRLYALEYVDDPKAKEVARRMDEKDKQLMQAGMMKGGK